jgi:sterol desaturase/sphingolipid hydroxylase (fatty acid hydroxylase superfamily)
MDLAAAATPGYFATMGLEYRYLKHRAARVGPSPADYERRDTVTSLGMGTASLLAPLVAAKILGPFVPGKGRFGRALVGTAVGAAVVTTVADRLARTDRVDGDTTARGRRIARRARQVAAVTGPTAIAAGGIAVTTTWLSALETGAMWNRRLVRDAGTGWRPLTAAILGWDFIYYWNHRFMHTSRYMWAIHVVHHSSERYNLSTALRQPVADALGTFLPYGALCLFGIRPALVEQARGLNLIYQYWIHTETIPKLGPFEAVFNTASHHRVHHGANRQYLDRNHGSILIVWDRLFGTFEPEQERVVYGLTKNLHSFNWGTVMFHEHAEMLRDVSRSTSWRERLSFVFRGPGWAYARHAERGLTPTPSHAARASGAGEAAPIG